MTDEERHIQELETDVDVRLANVWTAILELDGNGLVGPLLNDDASRVAFASFLRVAYGAGYQDALLEVMDGRGAELHRTHGYHAPL